MITVRCGCGRDVTVDNHLAGTLAKCPGCGLRVRIPESPEPKVPAKPQAPPAAAPPAAQREAPRPAPGAAAPAGRYYPPPPLAPAPEAPPRPGRADLIFLCVLVLLTIVVPWDIQDGKVTWSWDMLGDMAWGCGSVVLIALWVTALITFMLGCTFARLALSIPLAVMSSAGMAFWVIVHQKESLVILADPMHVFSSHPAVLNPLVGLVILLFLFSGARGRAEGGVVLGILQAVAAAGAMAMLVILLVPKINMIADELHNILALPKDKPIPDVPHKVELAWLLASLLFVALGGLVALLHGLVVHSRRGGPAKAAACLTRIGVVLLMLQIMAAPAIQGKWAGVLPASIKTIVLYSTPLFFCSGISRVIGDVISAVKTARAGAEQPAAQPAAS